MPAGARARGGARARLNVVCARMCPRFYLLLLPTSYEPHAPKSPETSTNGKFPKRMHAGPGHRGAPDSLVSTRTTGANKFDPRAYWYPAAAV